MNCPYCKGQTSVTNSRLRAKGSQVWRRRKCKACKNIWTTHEVIDLATSHNVTYPEQASQPFSRDILFMSIKDSLSHRKTALADATALTDTVLAQVLAKKSASIESSALKIIVHQVLKKFDPTAAAVYKATHNAR